MMAEGPRGARTHGAPVFLVEMGSLELLVEVWTARLARVLQVNGEWIPT